MLKKMRQRVILAAMLAFFAVIMLIGVSVNILNYMVVTKNADETLDVILSFEENIVRPEMEGNGFNAPPPEAPPPGFCSRSPGQKPVLPACPYSYLSHRA